MGSKSGESDENIRPRFAEFVRELRDITESASDLLNGNLHNGDYSGTTRNLTRRNRKAYLRAAQIAYDLRRQRAKIFQDPALFGEPAWDMLLDLYIADLKGKALSVTDACIGSAVPSTTALRWIAIIQEAGLVAREEDPKDARRFYLHLTDKGSSLMQAYFDMTLNQVQTVT
ncbi:MAG: MarR family transcriptional regulator [Novosphingobium sp.]